MAKLKYRPLNLGRWIVWGTTALVVIVLPLVFTSGFTLTLMSQIGIGVIFALSYNMLLGQGGMLSFGHAVYSGLGAYFSVHALNLIGKGSFLFPVTLLPLVGGVAGLVFGVVFGYVTTKKSGTTFSMISLGIGEMVFACSLMFPDFFGGEAGVTTNRVMGQPFLGVTYGPAIQVYYLIVGWTLVCMAAMFAWTQTPLGRMANAVRDNPERAEFVGYDTHMIRFLTVVLSAFFAGIAGGLNCINYEIVTAENVGAARSGGVLLATFIGGAGFFFGPILGSIVFFVMVIAVGAMTKAWLFYLGLLFLIMVLYAPRRICQPAPDACAGTQSTSDEPPVVALRCGPLHRSRAARRHHQPGRDHLSLFARRRYCAGDDVVRIPVRRQHRHPLDLCPGTAGRRLHRFAFCLEGSRAGVGRHHPHPARGVGMSREPGPREAGMRPPAIADGRRLHRDAIRDAGSEAAA